MKNKVFFDNVAQIVEESRHFVGRTVDLTMCITYFEIGRMIVEEEQGGEARAEYGRGLLEELSGFLSGRFGKSFSVATLRNARKFYQTYSPSISQTSFAKLESGGENRKQQTLFSVFERKDFSPIRQALSAESYPFKLSWSHYLILMRIKNEQERRFYEWVQEFEEAKEAQKAAVRGSAG